MSRNSEKNEARKRERDASGIGLRAIPKDAV